VYRGPVILSFPPFRLDLEEQRLQRNGDPIALTRREFAVLRYLALRPQRLVSVDELLAAIWAGTAVSRGVVKVAIRRIRAALGDGTGGGFFIETVGRRGYRFTAPAEPEKPDVVATPNTFVGREHELSRLHAHLEDVTGGARRIVLLTGEPGIGKTTLLVAFRTFAVAAGAWVATGECVERFAGGEAYHPILLALGRLCRESIASEVIP